MSWADRWQLGLSFMHISLALLLLALPPQSLVRPRYRVGRFQRPWFAIWPNLAWGFGSLLLAIAEQWVIAPIVRPALLIGAYTSMALALALVGRLIFRIWRNSQATVSQHTGPLIRDAQFFTLDQQMYQATLEGVVQQFLMDGHKIHAIKRVRELTGWGLQEAKEYVDEVEGRLESAHNQGT